MLHSPLIPAVSKNTNFFKFLGKVGILIELLKIRVIYNSSK